MKRIIVNIVLLAVALYGGKLLLDILLARDLLTHLNECHEELHVKDRINAPLSDSQVDALYDQWGECVRQKGNIVDRIFGGKQIEESMTAMKQDRKEHGPYDQRAPASDDE
jgi:hypothetical protein